MLVYITPSLSHEDKKASGSPYWVEERKSPSLHCEESLNGSQFVSAGVDLVQRVYICCAEEFSC